MKTIATFGILLFACSVASADALMVQMSWEHLTAGSRFAGVRGHVLLDGQQVNGGFLSVWHNWGLNVTDGTWDGESLSVSGKGCWDAQYFCPEQVPMSLVDDVFMRNDEAVLLSSELRFEQYQQVPIGDSNLDGVFDSGDLVKVFVHGEYEDNQICGLNEFGQYRCELNELGGWNSSWQSGDWNADREFDSGDLVFAFAEGSYEAPRASAAESVISHQPVGSDATRAIPEPSTAILLGLGALGLLFCRRF